MQQLPSWLSRPASQVRLLSFALLSAFLLLTPVTAMAQSADLAGPGSFAVRDGVVVDAGQGMVYLMNPSGGIDAVKLATGETAWSSQEAARPLALAGGVLVAQARPTTAGELSIVNLDTASGAAAGSTSIALPEGVWARVSQDLQSTFRVRAVANGGTVTLAWTETRSAGKDAPAQGYLASEEEGASPAATRRAAKPGYSVEQGAVRLDVARGQVTPLGDREIANRGLASHISLSQGQFIANAAGRQFLSADGRHVLVSQRAAGQTGYTWSVYERASGALLGTASSQASVTPFAVIQGRLVYETRPSGTLVDGKMVQQPLQLRAVTLATGQELWARAMLDTEYRGPFPQ